MEDFVEKRRIQLAVFVVSLLGLVAAGCAGPSSQTESSEGVQTRPADTKTAIGVRKPKHVGVALMTAEKMLSGEAAQKASAMVIVACGPAIRALAKQSKFAEDVRAGLGNGVRVKACGVTVERMGFDASRFIEGVEVVDNGFVELIRLQAAGYRTIEL